MTVTNFEAELLGICDQLTKYLPHPYYLIHFLLFFQIRQQSSAFGSESTSKHAMSPDKIQFVCKKIALVEVVDT